VLLINNSSLHCQVLLKFSTLEHYVSSGAAKWSKSTLCQIQDGTRTKIEN